MDFYSPTHGRLTRASLKLRISQFMKSDQQAQYRIVIGVDSQRNAKHTFDFVTAVVIQRIGKGGIYFWKREVISKKIGLKERMYTEAIMSLQSAEDVIELFKGTGVSKYDIEIHVDIGPNGKTKELINEIVGMVRSSGYTVRIKPDSFGASKVADRHTN